MNIENFGQFNKSLIQTYGKNFRHMDTDNVKGVSKEELQANAQEAEKPDLIAKVEDNFDNIDSDGNGNLSVKEMVKSFKAGLEEKYGEDVIETVIKDEMSLDDSNNDVTTQTPVISEEAEATTEEDPAPITPESDSETTILSDILNSNTSNETEEDNTSVIEETAEIIRAIAEEASTDSEIDILV